ncbi:MAG: helix-turn-helix domain-containing protein [Phycisphaerales bacterium]|jgi:excisionase family DNA binding protein
MSDFNQRRHHSDSTPLAVGRVEAAAMLGISERLLWTWTKSGLIPHVRIGSRVLYPVEQLRIWLNKQAGSTASRIDQ